MLLLSDFRGWLISRKHSIMRLNDILDKTAEFFQWSFGILEALGDGFNWLIIVVMSILGVVWVSRMVKYNKEAAQNGTLK